MVCPAIWLREWRFEGSIDLVLSYSQPTHFN
jgi:hypothetical protein